MYPNPVRLMIPGQGNSHIGAHDRLIGSVEAEQFLDRAAVPAAIEAHFDTGNPGLLQERDQRCLQLGDLFTYTASAFGLPGRKVSHHGRQVVHGFLLDNARGR